VHDDSGCARAADGLCPAGLQAHGGFFAQTLVLGWLANPQASLEGLAQGAAAVGVTIRAQSLDERFTEAAAMFRDDLLACAVQTVMAADPVAIPLLERFRAVALLDSSTITLPAALALWWPGCSAGTAALKLHVRDDLCRGHLSGLLVRERRTFDRSATMQTVPLPLGARRISDLSFFTRGVFAAMTAQGVSWLSRRAPGTAVYTLDGARWDVLDLRAAAGTPTVERDGALGVAQRLPARLLAARVPAEAPNQRRRRSAVSTSLSAVPAARCSRRT